MKNPPFLIIAQIPVAFFYISILSVQKELIYALFVPVVCTFFTIMFLIPFFHGNIV
jgi:hypothetical protein